MVDNLQSINEATIKIFNELERLQRNSGYAVFLVDEFFGGAGYGTEVDESGSFLSDSI